jgi:hypothetical protein
MWNSFLERGKELAEKAKAAAETLDKQIDASVGLDSNSGTTVTEDLSSGLKGASSLLFGMKGSNNDGSQSKIDSGYLSKRESIAFVSEDDDVWGDEDEIVINDEDWSTAPPSQDEDETAKIEATAIPTNHERCESLEKDNDLENASSDKSADRTAIDKPGSSDPDQDQRIRQEPDACAADHFGGSAPAAIESGEEAEDYIVDESNAASSPDGDESLEDRTPSRTSEPAASNILQSSTDCNVTTVREEKQEGSVGERQPDEAKFDSLSILVDDRIDATSEGDRKNAMFKCAIENIYSSDAAGIQSETCSPAPEASSTTTIAAPASGTSLMPPQSRSTAEAEPEQPSVSAAESLRSIDGGIAPLGIESKGSEDKGSEEDGSPTIEPSAGVAVRMSKVPQSVTSLEIFGSTAEMSAEACVTRSLAEGTSLGESTAPLDEHMTPIFQPFPDELCPTGEMKVESPRQPLTEARSNNLMPSSPVLPHDSEAVIRMQQELVAQREITRLLEERLEQVSTHLLQREEQLVSKTTQLSVLQADWEKERGELQAKILATKDEAKRRIQKAKERADAAEAKLKSVSSDDSQQAEVIAALRSEGERLAVKQAEMEKAVRAAKSESRQLREVLDDETQAKEVALANVKTLEADLKETRENLASARRGESQADKLESELALAREELERKGSAILSMEQQIKECKKEIKELVEELENSRRGAAIDSQAQQEKLMKHHEESVKDLESKLRSMEREAAIREDALRHEVDELRKRWQDAVRRADALSMDIQSSTAPLMRQLESAERQNRVRAAAAAEIETKLRTELEETVVANELLTKECSEIRTRMNRLDRRAKEAENELRTNRTALETKTEAVRQLEDRIQTMEAEGARLKAEWAEIERLANEGVARVRSEMTQTVVDSEARYRLQIDSLKAELAHEQEKVRNLEQQVQGMIDSTGVNTNHVSQPLMMSNHESKPQRLRKSVDQAQILAGALGLDDERDDDEGDDDALADGLLVDESHGDSFAAIEELSSRLKAAKVELKELRKTLADSERSRNQLVEELGESRIAKEKLPLFETKVKELTAENEEQALEIMGLREDIDEVRELYRAQLNMLLEEKAKISKRVPHENGEPGVDHASSDGPAGAMDILAESAVDHDSAAIS